MKLDLGRMVHLANFLFSIDLLNGVEAIYAPPAVTEKFEALCLCMLDVRTVIRQALMEIKHEA
jgi:hypothetical protein